MADRRSPRRTNSDANGGQADANTDDLDPLHLTRNGDNIPSVTLS
jgi:hypothetical protein